ncbi:hypothetical protein [Gemmata sp.]|uniref:hypothetical protein n=1 Tax=Gemmata sp. TaxID=1914242 RepID=UPI003F6EFAA6
MSHLATGLIGFAVAALVGWSRHAACRERLDECRRAAQRVWASGVEAILAANDRIRDLERQLEAARRGRNPGPAPDDDWRDKNMPDIAGRIGPKE